jgi:hypothetical protein
MQGSLDGGSVDRKASTHAGQHTEVYPDSLKSTAVADECLNNNHKREVITPSTQPSFTLNLFYDTEIHVSVSRTTIFRWKTTSDKNEKTHDDVTVC